MSEKDEIRLFVREKEKSLSDEYLRISGKMIVETILDIPAYRDSEVIFSFVGVCREVDTKPILMDALSKGKTIAVPRCRKKGDMDAFSIQNLSDLHKGYYGLMEPDNSRELVAPGQIDLCIVPCLACDKKGRRLGKGGGYYDRYLAGCDGLRICICREKFIMDEIPVDSHDIRMDIIVTEKKCIHFPR